MRRALSVGLLAASIAIAAEPRFAPMPAPAGCFNGAWESTGRGGYALKCCCDLETLAGCVFDYGDAAPRRCDNCRWSERDEWCAGSLDSPAAVGLEQRGKWDRRLPWDPYPVRVPYPSLEDFRLSGSSNQGFVYVDRTVSIRRVDVHGREVKP